MTTLKIPPEEIEAEVRRICAKHGMGFEIVAFEPPHNGSPFRHRVTVTDPEAAHGVVASMAVRTEDEIPEAISWVWHQFVSWGVL